MIILYTGRRGSGMTLSMVEQFRKLIAMPVPINIWSNMHFNDISAGSTKHTSYNAFSSIQDIPAMQIYPATIFWDMAYGLLETRTDYQEQLHKNIDFMEWVQRSGSTLYVNTQLSQLIHPMLRRYIDFEFKVRKSPKGKVRTVSYSYKAERLYDMYNSLEILPIAGHRNQIRTLSMPRAKLSPHILKEKK